MHLEGALHLESGTMNSGATRSGATHLESASHLSASDPNTVLFLDARRIFRQISRAHRDFTPAQIEFLANIVRLYRGEELEFRHTEENEGGTELPEWDALFPEGNSQDVPGLCKSASIEEIEDQGWSLNPGRYVGIARHEDGDFDFYGRLEELNEEFVLLNIVVITP